jgi:hypothetical protein
MGRSSGSMNASARFREMVTGFLPALGRATAGLLGVAVVVLKALLQHHHN